MPSPLKGVWELVSDDEGKVLWMFSDTHFGYVSTRLGGRGYIGTYITEGNHLHMTRMLSTPTNPVTTLTVEFQRDGDTLTNENSPKQASGYQREMHYDETPQFLKLFPL